jgi:hypothetical protein
MIYTVKPSYNDISLYDTLYIASNIMSYQLICNIVILLIRTAFVYNNTNYAVPFMTLQPSSSVCVCVCVCVCMFACTCTHTCIYMWIYVCVHTYTHFIVMSCLEDISRNWNKATHFECFGLVRYGWRWGKHQNLCGYGSKEKKLLPWMKIRSQSSTL